MHVRVVKEGSTGKTTTAFCCGDPWTWDDWAKASEEVVLRPVSSGRKERRSKAV